MCIRDRLKLIELMKSNLDLSRFGENTHGNLLEAIVGAVFLDQGFKTCEAFIHKRIINPHVNISKLEGKITSYKSLIIEWCQKKKLKLNFDCTEDQTAEKLKHFTACLKIDNKITNKILNSLGFKVSKDWEITIPSWRPDISINEDIVEEVVRIYGLNLSLIHI